MFEARPSLKDMDNQRNYQVLTRDTSTNSSSGGGADDDDGAGSSGKEAAAGGGCKGSCGGALIANHHSLSSNNNSNCSSSVLEPFIGFILSPFDPALPLPHTSVKAFVVQQMGAGGGGGGGGGGVGGSSSGNLVPFNIRWVWRHCLWWCVYCSFRL